MRYAALGSEPFWMLAIGDDAIVLTLGPDTGARGLNEVAFQRVLPREEGGVRRWESGEGTRVIGVEARPGPCRDRGGRIYEDKVTVTLSGRMLGGCGGRMIRGGRSL
jgi:uncharacterized membrane protein